MPETMDVLRDELVLLGYRAQSAAEVLQAMAAVLYEDGAIKDSYYPAMMEREQQYPTGLPTEGIKVALPHAGVEHVNYSALAVAVLDPPVAFCQMDDPTCELPVEIVFMLANADPEEQVQTLRMLVDMFDEPESLRRIRDARTPAEVVDQMREGYLARMAEWQRGRQDGQ